MTSLGYCGAPFPSVEGSNNRRASNRLSGRAHARARYFVLILILTVSVAYVPREFECLVGLAFLGTGVYIVVLRILSGGRDLRESIAPIGDSFGRGAELNGPSE